MRREWLIALGPELLDGGLGDTLNCLYQTSANRLWHAFPLASLGEVIVKNASKHSQFAVPHEPSLPGDHFALGIPFIAFVQQFQARFFKTSNRQLNTGRAFQLNDDPPCSDVLAPLPTLSQRAVVLLDFGDLPHQCTSVRSRVGPDRHWR